MLLKGKNGHKASVMGAGRGVVVLLQWLREWKGSVQWEGQARQGCLKRTPKGFARTQSQQSVHKEARMP